MRSGFWSQNAFHYQKNITLINSALITITRKAITYDSVLPTVFIMNILTYLDAETYLRNKQVYFKKEIVNSDFETLAEIGKVHNVGDVELKRLSDTVVAFYIQINDIETTMYEHKTDLELFAWIKQNFIPVCELVNSYQS